MPIKAAREAEVDSLSARAKILSALGTGEWMNFRKSSKGGKAFSIQKFMLQILDLYTGFF